MTLSGKIGAIIAGAIEQRIAPGGVVLVALGGHIVHYAAYGSTMYDGEQSRPVEVGTIYDIASLTKMFTATAALRLHDQGALDLEAPVECYIPEITARGIRVEHLLTHTSGLDIRLSALRHLEKEGLLRAAYAAKPLHDPGARVAYTNVNSLLLGEIVARRSGLQLEAAIGGLVIRPLALRETRFRPPERLRERIAPTEVDEDWRGGLVHGTVHDESAHALGGVAGHAGLFSTAADLYAFCAAWLDPIVDLGFSIVDRPSQSKSEDSKSKLLHRETARRATTNQTAHLGLGCGLGWMMDRPSFMGAAPAGSFGHTGFTGPAIVVEPRREVVVVVLSNRVYPRRSPPAHHAVTAAIVDVALAEPE